MGRTHFTLILASTAFRLFAQPALPAANQTLAPIANAYSASWIYYTTNPASGLGFLNGASIPYVMTASNNVVAYVNAATNGLVTSAITNGLATTNWVRSNYYPTSNPSLFVTVTVTNGLATVSYVNTVTNGLVTASVTNGLATTNFVILQPSANWSGTTGGKTIPAGVTYYYMPNNSFTNVQTTDTAGITRVPATRSLTLQKLFVVTSGNVSFGDTLTVTIMTNGTASSIAASVSGSSATTANDTTHTAPVVAGVQIGVRITTTSGATPVNCAWSFEGY